MELTDFRKKYGRPGGPPGTPWGGANGVYVVSPACPTQFWEGERCGNYTPSNVKIGKASGVDGFVSADGKGRLRHYRTYWPNGVTVHAVLTTPSFDSTVHTVKDVALQRETTLRRIFKHIGLVGFGSNGRGGDNGTSHLGSEWINLTPNKIMNYLLAAGPIRHANDHLYGCTPDKCELVSIDKVSRNVTRLNDVVKSLEVVLDDEKKLGVRGRPIVLPQSIIHAAKKKTHRLHTYADLLVSNVNKEMQLAQRRLANRKKREVNSAEAKIADARLTRFQRQVKRKRLDAMKKRQPRNIAAIRPSYGMDVAMTLKRPGEARRPIERFIAEPAPAAKRPVGTAAKRPRKSNQDALNTIKKYPRHRQRYPPTARKKKARLLFENQDQNDLSAELSDETPGRVSRNPAASRAKSCEAKGVVLYDYSKYTYFDVTGDGRCYYYAILKALGSPLYRGLGKLSNTINTIKYFSPTREKIWKTRLNQATFQDPIDVLYDSVEMCRALLSRGILYITKVVRTSRDFSEIHEYMRDPIAQIRKTATDAIYKINDNGIQMIPELTARLRKNKDSVKTAAFKRAFADGRVVSFVWRNIRGLPAHYEVIIPKRN